ncbi:MAG: hypothetical protein ACLQLH_02130 [Terracidiphilus sp.]
MDEFEKKLRLSIERQMAPSGLKAKIMLRRRGTARQRRFSLFAWRGLAASIVSVSLCVLAAVAIYGGYEQRQAEERRKGEAARQQVMTALRITSHALDNLNKQLAAHHRANQD